jgi:hypothetical protein
MAGKRLRPSVTPPYLQGLNDEPHPTRAGSLHDLAEMFLESDSSVALEKMVRQFVGLWASDPVALRLRAMSALDPEIARGIRSRDARRPHIAERS